MAVAFGCVLLLSSSLSFFCWSLLRLLSMHSLPLLSHCSFSMQSLPLSMLYSPPTLTVAQGRSARAEAARGPERSHADL